MGIFGDVLAGGLGDVVTAYAGHREAVMNRTFQRDMSNTAHQREVADLKAAGLNPILSARYGGSSTPGGSQAVIPSGFAGVNTALAARRNRAEVDLLEEQAGQTRNNSNLLSVQYNTELERRDREYWLKKIAEQDYQTARAEAAKGRGTEDIYNSQAGRIMQWINAISQSIQGIGNSAQSIERPFNHNRKGGK